MRKGRRKKQYFFGTDGKAHQDLDNAMYTIHPTQINVLFDICRYYKFIRSLRGMPI